MSDLFVVAVAAMKKENLPLVLEGVNLIPPRYAHIAYLEPFESPLVRDNVWIGGEIGGTVSIDYDPLE